MAGHPGAGALAVFRKVRAERTQDKKEASEVHGPVLRTIRCRLQVLKPRRLPVDERWREWMV